MKAALRLLACWWPIIAFSVAILLIAHGLIEAHP